MEVGKVSQNHGQIVENTELGNIQEISGNEVSSGNQVGQRDFQVNLDATLKTKLMDLAKSLANREQLIQSLPENIKAAVQQLLQDLSSTTDLSQGMETVLNSQKNIAEKLNNLGNLLELAADLHTDEHNNVQVFLKEIAEILKDQSDVSPEQSANELLQLAKQIAALPQGEVKQAIETFLQQLSPESMKQLNENEKNIVLQLAQTLTSSSVLSTDDLKRVAKQLLQLVMPEDMQRLNEDGKKLLAQVVKLLGQNMPSELQQLVVDSNMLELPQSWAVLKAIDAQPYKDIKPTTLKQASETLEQLYHELKTSSDKAGVIAKLQQFIKNMPTEIGKAVEQAIKQRIPDSLLTLAETFNTAAGINEEASSDVQSFISKLAEKFTSKVPSVAVDTANLLSQLAKQVSGNNFAADQLKALVKLIQTQLVAGDLSLSKNEQPTLEQLAKVLEQNMPQALQDVANKNKIPELPKIWALLRALGADQWQNAESQHLQKTASVVKELAQSVYKSTTSATEKQVDHSVLSFSVPLYFADGTNYPAHIHIYHQQKNNENQLVKRKFETWMRVSVDTQNIGIVDSVFRLYEDDKLDVRVIFPDSSAISEFTKSIPDIRKSINDTKLSLGNIMINKG